MREHSCVDASELATSAELGFAYVVGPAHPDSKAIIDKTAISLKVIFLEQGSSTVSEEK